MLFLVTLLQSIINYAITYFQYLQLITKVAYQLLTHVFKALITHLSLSCIVVKLPMSRSCKRGHAFNITSILLLFLPNATLRKHKLVMVWGKLLTAYSSAVIFLFKLVFHFCDCLKLAMEFLMLTW